MNNAEMIRVEVLSNLLNEHCIIFNGKDEQTMRKMMKDAIHPYKTIIKDDRAKDN